MGKTNLPQKTVNDDTIDVAVKVFEKIVKDKRILKTGTALGEAMSKGIDNLFGVKR